MAQATPNFNMTLPLGSEKVDVAQLNYNFGVCDTEIKRAQDVAAAVSSSLSAVTGQVEQNRQDCASLKASRTSMQERLTAIEQTQVRPMFDGFKEVLLFPYQYLNFVNGAASFYHNRAGETVKACFITNSYPASGRVTFGVNYQGFDDGHIEISGWNCDGTGFAGGIRVDLMIVL